MNSRSHRYFEEVVYMDILAVRAGETISFTFEMTMESEYLIEFRHTGKYLWESLDWNRDEFVETQPPKILG